MPPESKLRNNIKGSEHTSIIEATIHSRGHNMYEYAAPNHYSTIIDSLACREINSES